MYIEQLDNERLLIALTKDEAALFPGKTLPPSYGDPSLRTFLGLISLAAAKSGIKLSNKRIVVELLPGSGDRLLIVTFTPQRLLPAGRSVFLCVRFASAGDLYTCFERLSATPSAGAAEAALYRTGDPYVAVLEFTPFQARSIHGILAEYGRVTTVSRRKLLHLDEFAEKLFCGSVSDWFLY